MLLLLSDVHCRYGVIDLQLRHAAEQLGALVTAAVVLGDLGLFEPFLRTHFRNPENRFAVPCSFIEGNHEDFDRFEHLAARYREFLTHLPRGSVQVLAGHRVLCLGGAQYMDAQTTPPGAAVRERDIELCLQHPPESVDLVISHDCPENIGVTSQPGFEHYGPPGIRGTERVIRHLRPRLWVFGHHHRWFDIRLDGTRFLGLPQSWNGYALIAEDGQLTTVANTVSAGLPARPHFSLLRRRPGTSRRG